MSNQYRHIPDAKKIAALMKQSGLRTKLEVFEAVRKAGHLISRRTVERVVEGGHLQREDSIEIVANTLGATLKDVLPDSEEGNSDEQFEVTNQGGIATLIATGTQEYYISGDDLTDERLPSLFAAFCRLFQLESVKVLRISKEKNEDQT